VQTGPIPEEFRSGPVIMALWHQQICMVPLLHKPNPRTLVGLISASRDGYLIRTVAKLFGIGAVVGSSSKGAISAARGLVSVSRQGNSLLITPDGPRGPARKAKPGAVEIARLTRLPLIPCAAWPARGMTAKSWDSFRIPHPFTTVALAYGEPIAADDLTALENAMNSLTEQARARVQS
jgi:lysophospholipid acyltransferase (LPLAT)-like uncharacterized protein